MVIGTAQNIDAKISARNFGKIEHAESKISFSEVLRGKSEQKSCPYSSMAENGIIEYNGVVFVCDYKSNSICLGDMSKPNEVLNISLPSGGHLKLNVNNFGDIANAAGMFTPADLAAIMRAISQYNHCVRKVKEADEEEIETAEEVVEHATEVSNGNTEKLDETGNNQDAEADEPTIWYSINFSSALRAFEESHILTAQELKEEKDWRDMSDEEWDKMIDGVDKKIDAYKEYLREMKEIQEEAAEKAALEADSGMKANAASSAAFASSNGFVSGTASENDASEEAPTEDVVDHEKNWTKKLKTDNQTILMTAKEAQKMERNVMAKLQEIQLDGVTTANVSADIVIDRYKRNREDDSIL